MTSDRLRAYWSAWSALASVLGCWRAYLESRNDQTRAALLAATLKYRRLKAIAEGMRDGVAA